MTEVKRNAVYAFVFLLNLFLSYADTNSPDKSPWVASVLGNFYTKFEQSCQKIRLRSLVTLECNLCMVGTWLVHAIDI